MMTGIESIEMMRDTAQNILERFYDLVDDRKGSLSPGEREALDMLIEVCTTVKDHDDLLKRAALVRSKYL